MSEHVTIRVACDGHDMIRAHGPVPGCTEIDVCDTGVGFIRLSTGDVFRAEFDPAAGWRIEPHTPNASGSTKWEIGREDRSGDRLTVTGPVKWVELWPNYPPTEQDIREKVSMILCGSMEYAFDPSRLLTEDELQETYRIACAVRARNWRGVLTEAA